MHTAVTQIKIRAVADHVQHENDLCAYFGRYLKKKPLNTVVEHDERIEKDLENDREEIDQRTDNGGQNGKNNADLLADFDKFFLRSVPVDEFRVDIHVVHRRLQSRNGCAAIGLDASQCNIKTDNANVTPTNEQRGKRRGRSDCK